MSYPKSSAGRGTVEGGQEALVDLKLLASCPILIGTFYSSYSETAKLLSGAFYVQVSFLSHASVLVVTCWAALMMVWLSCTHAHIMLAPLLQRHVGSGHMRIHQHMLIAAATAAAAAAAALYQRPDLF